MTSKAPVAASSQLKDAQVMLEQLQAESSAQLDKILFEGKAVKAFQSSVNVFMDRYRLSKSYIDNIALWYGALRWWNKTALFISVSAIAAGLGFLLSLLIALPIVVLTLYSAGALFLENHQHVTEARDAQLSEDISQFEKELAASVFHLGEIETHLKSVFASLFKLNLDQINHTIEFKAQVGVFEQQVLMLKQVITEINHAKQVISQSKSRISGLIESARSNFSGVSKKLSGEISALEGQLQAQIETFAKRADTLQGIYLSAKQNSKVLNRLITELRLLVTGLKQSSNQKKPAHSSASQANQFLDGQQKSHAETQKNSEKRKKAAVSRAQDTDELLARANRILLGADSKANARRPTVKRHCNQQ